ncbi:MAG TPA: hypothetical protein VKU60_19895 [Chloroflexota bacterium]|nr:hypothetical protein [Chloroflexota bacterium]
MAASGALVTTPAPSPALGGGSNAKQQLIPFRLATYRRRELQQSWAPTLKTTQQQNTIEIKGSGLMGNIRLRVRADCSGNSANVAFAEDAPWNSLLQIQVSDANGQTINIDGYSLFIANKCYAKMRGVNYLDQSSVVVQQAGNGATGGTFEFFVDIPIVNNDRDLKGLLGNQSQTNSYKIVVTLNASGNIYTTAPTVLPTVTIDVFYESWAIPPARNSAGTPQEQVPKHFGTLNYLNAINNTTLPAPGALKHYLSNVGRDIRWMAFIWRSGSGSTPRATADNELTSVNGNGNDTGLQLKLGAIEPYDVTYDFMRSVMYTMFGVDFPKGIIVFPFNDDFLGYAGAEASGADFLHTQGISERNAFLQATYQSAFAANASNLLTIVTADTEYRPPVTPQAAG